MRKASFVQKTNRPQPPTISIRIRRRWWMSHVMVRSFLRTSHVPCRSLSLWSNRFLFDHVANNSESTGARPWSTLHRSADIKRSGSSESSIDENRLFGLTILFSLSLAAANVTRCWLSTEMDLRCPSFSSMVWTTESSCLTAINNDHRGRFVIDLFDQSILEHTRCL